MTEGGIANWKKKEGESFAAGDVLVEIVSSCHVSLALASHFVLACPVGNRQGDY
jgi:hypothetical protein